MIELEIKVKASDEENLQRMLRIMTDALISANKTGKIDLTLSIQEHDNNLITVIRKEVIQDNKTP
jgi:hypothetical protein